MTNRIKPNIIPVGAVDWDRKLFDALIPLPDGTTYNSYLVKGSEKTALIDTVDPTKTNVLIENLVKAGADRIDYIIAHHGEQDHSGSIPDVLTLYPEAKVVTNAKCKEMLISLLQIDESKFIVVEDGQSISLGNKALKFLFTPWVHWPETICTYLPEDKVLFTCDFFGSHLASNRLFVEDKPLVYESAKRYYAEIMMPFRGPIRKNLEKIKDLQIDIIAPSHGPVYQEPAFIIDAYKDWVSDNVKNEVVLPYVSMHGSTEKMVEYLVDGLTERGIKVHQFNLVGADIGKLAMALVDAATVVIGCPTMLVTAHPLVSYAAVLTNLLRPKTRFASIIGSYGWTGKMVEYLTGLMPNMKLDIIEPVLAKGYPTEKDFAALDILADRILAKHREIKIAD